MINSRKNPQLCQVIWTVAIFVCAAGFAATPAAAQEQQAAQQSAPAQNTPPAPAQASVPSQLVLPAGTLIQVRLSDEVSSERNQPGDRFTASLEQPLIAEGWVVAHRGQLVTGRVTSAQRAGRVSGVSRLAIELNELTVADGQILPLRTQLIESSGGTSNGRDATVIATTTGLGALIGAAAGGGSGAGIGAGAGAAAGVIGVLTTRGRPTVLNSETLLTFRLEEPLAVSTERGYLAFQPVTQADYGSGRDASPRRLDRRYGPRGPYYSPYYFTPYPYAYPGAGYLPFPVFFGFTSVYSHRGGFRR
jgi:hypothetical protein